MPASSYVIYKTSGVVEKHEYFNVKIIFDVASSVTLLCLDPFILGCSCFSGRNELTQKFWDFAAFESSGLVGTNAPQGAGNPGIFYISLTIQIFIFITPLIVIL